MSLSRDGSLSPSGLLPSASKQVSPSEQPGVVRLTLSASTSRSQSKNNTVSLTDLNKQKTSTFFCKSLFFKLLETLGKGNSMSSTELNSGSAESEIVRKKLLVIKEWCLSALEGISNELNKLNEDAKVTADFSPIATKLKGIHSAFEASEKLLGLKLAKPVACTYTDPVLKARYTILNTVLRLLQVVSDVTTALQAINQSTDMEKLNTFVASIRSANSAIGK